MQLTLIRVVVRYEPMAVQGNADLAALLLLEFVSIELYCVCMCEYDVV